MFEIKYNFSNNTHYDIKNSSESDLRYSLFLGNLILKTRNNSIIIDWDWIPLFDFDLCLISIYNSFLNNKLEEVEFDFTESDEKLIFKKEGSYIKISTTFSNEVLEMTIEDFQIAIESFHKNLVIEIMSKNEELKNNDNFLKYIKEAKDM